MATQFVISTMNGFTLFSRKFELRSRLQGDIRAIKLLLAEGRELLAAERYGEAACKFRQVIFQDPFQITALECLAESYAKVGRTEEAGRYHRRAAALHHDA